MKRLQKSRNNRNKRQQLWIFLLFRHNIEKKKIFIEFVVKIKVNRHYISWRMSGIYKQIYLLPYVLSLQDVVLHNLFLLSIMRVNFSKPSSLILCLCWVWRYITTLFCPRVFNISCNCQFSKLSVLVMCPS